MKLTRQIVDQIAAEARAQAPHEACGYVAGKGDRAEFLIPMRNTSAGPGRFSFDPKEQFAAVREARAAGLDLIAVYHSHPAGEARMSEEDVRLANDVGIVYLVYSLAGQHLRAYRVSRDKAVTETGIELADVPSRRRPEPLPPPATASGR